MLQIQPSAPPGFRGNTIAVTAWTEEDFFAGLGSAPKTLTAGQNNDSAVLNVTGYNAFMGVLNCSGAGATLGVFLLYLHPLTNAVIATRTITASVAPAASLVASWGKDTANLPNDVFTIQQIRLVAATANITLTGMVLYGMVH